MARGWVHTEEDKRYISNLLKARGHKPPNPSTFSEETKEKRRLGIKRAWAQGRQRMFSKELCEKLSIAHKGQVAWNKGLKGYHSGDKHHNWKGGITTVNKKIRASLEYEEWRKAVFERDDYTCQTCGEVGGILHADHIRPFALFPELRLEVSNGKTLCKLCHSLTNTFGRTKLTREDFTDVIGVFEEP